MRFSYFNVNNYWKIVLSIGTALEGNSPQAFVRFSGGGELEWQGISLGASMDSQKYPKHVFPGLTLIGSLNKYSNGIWRPTQAFFFIFFNPKQEMMQ